MEKWARDGNLGSWTRRSEIEEGLLREFLPSRHFHSRNDEMTTSDWMEQVREASLWFFENQDDGINSIEFLLFRKGATYYSSSPSQGGEETKYPKIIAFRNFSTGKKMFAYRSRGRRRAPKGPRRSLSREFRSRAPSPSVSRPKPVSHTDIEIGVGPGSRL